MGESRQLIDDLERRRKRNVTVTEINQLIGGFHFDFPRSSSHVDYKPQREAWLNVARHLDCTLLDLADAIASPSKTPECDHYLVGIEGLWELTRHPELFKLTDYDTSRLTDQLVVSYFYGNDDRREAFRKYASHKPEDMASSIAEFLSGAGAKAKGNVVTYDPTRFVELDWRIDSIDELTEPLLSSGWNVEIRPSKTTKASTMTPLMELVVHGLDFRGAMHRILGR